MKYLFCVAAACALMFASSQEANAQIFRGRCGNSGWSSGPVYYSYPSYSYSYYSYPSCNTGGYYVRGCNGTLYYVSPSTSYVSPSNAQQPKVKEAPSFQDLPAPKKVDSPSGKTTSPAPAPTVAPPPVITVPAPGFQDLPPKK